MTSRYAQGGLEPRFLIERVDGKPIAAHRRYAMVLPLRMPIASKLKTLT
jgi:hypothetical protein